MNVSPLSNESAGLSLRRSLLGPLGDTSPTQVKFIEVAPENWINIGGRYGKGFKACVERFPVGCHGLSLSLGGLAPLNWPLLKNIRKFLADNNVVYYSEHLSSCDDQRPLYDLMPLPFNDDTVKYVAQRIRQVQDFLERRIAIENVSYYLSLDTTLSEAAFINAVVSEADCMMLLDVNNVYVNSINHCYDPVKFLDAMPAERILYYHVAGHNRVTDDLCIDSHGDAVIDPVWDLLGYAYRRMGTKFTVLEREANLPPLSTLILELGQIRKMQREAQVSNTCGKNNAILSQPAW